jgi:hypothetical protein
MHRIAYVLLALAAGCASGRDFTRPAAENLALGVVTRADILAAYGRPDRQMTRVVSAPGEGSGSSRSDAPAMGSLTSLFYTYETPGRVAWSGAALHQKLLKFDFANDRLFSYSYLSNFERDSSDFDEAKMSALANGITTKEDVLALFGDPSGRAMFPALLPGDERFVYQYVDASGGERLVKRLELVFDDDDVLRDFGFVSDLGPSRRSGNADPPLLGPNER